LKKKRILIKKLRPSLFRGVHYLIKNKSGHLIIIG
jgi:hypothetical protein